MTHYIYFSVEITNVRFLLSITTVEIVISENLTTLVNYLISYVINRMINSHHEKRHLILTLIFLV